MATVYFLCGMAASGKTTMAKKLELEKGAVRLTLDERMKAKYDYSIWDKEYGRLVVEEKELMWQEAKEILKDGRDVILDWSLWSQQSRIEWPQKVLAAGYDYKLFYLDVPIEVLRQRLSVRNQNIGPAIHFISIEELDRFSKIFEPPTEEENLNLEVIPVS